MKRTILYGAFVFLLVCGCKTKPEVIEVYDDYYEPVEEVIDPQMPLTKEILLRIGGSYKALANNVNQYQMISLGRITLEREFTVPNDGREPGGIAKFEDVHTRDEIIIQNETECQVLNLEETGKEIVLSVCFESGSTDNILSFASSVGDADGYFYLKYAADPNLPSFGEEKGTLVYGGLRYKVKFSGVERPYLLIKLSQKDTDIISSRILDGRKVN
jgi:hypothetical protein